MARTKTTRTTGDSKRTTPPPFVSSDLLDISPEPTLFHEESDWQKEWKGMPEFVQGKQREYAKIIVRFRNEADLKDFARLIGQKLNQHSQCTWHPELRPDKSTVKKYVSEP